LELGLPGFESWVCKRVYLDLKGKDFTWIEKKKGVYLDKKKGVYLDLKAGDF
jgi:hypothetical protein